MVDDGGVNRLGLLGEIVSTDVGLEAPTGSDSDRYGLIASLVSIAIIAAVSTLGAELNWLYIVISACTDNIPGPCPPPP